MVEKAHRAQFHQGGLMLPSSPSRLTARAAAVSRSASTAPSSPAASASLESHPWPPRPYPRHRLPATVSFSWQTHFISTQITQSTPS